MPLLLRLYYLHKTRHKGVSRKGVLKSFMAFLLSSEAEDFSAWEVTAFYSLILLTISLLLFVIIL
ncbi:hypothetical protein FHS90_001099 [Rufibacter quisquiliarum]|uniref:Uncharacterized protein n=1 Tax=Rufibacter quisquiliarum TaxID=1549639 RepID=A0A839GLD1_9BACT|nr:hypothetical protein [Rufibacter quisquiliarum]